MQSLHKVKSWLTTDNLPFAGYDIDHVAVTPSTVLAVETKYRGRVPNPKYEDSRHASELRAAAQSARKLRLFLLSKKLNASCTVTPVLMTWGPGRPKLPAGYRQEGEVVVVDSEYPQLWSHLFAAPTLSDQLRTEIHAAVQDYAHVRARHESLSRGSLRREMWLAFMEGRRSMASERAARRELHRTLQRRHGRRQSEPSPAD